MSRILKAGTTAESTSRHPKVLIISQGAPGVGKDANSIMLRRLLVGFPKDSYVVLASSRNWPDNCVPERQWNEGYRCFRNSLRHGGSRVDQKEPSTVTPPTGRSAFLTTTSVKNCLRAIFLRVFLDPLALIVQTRSATAEAVALVRSEAITSILAVSDYGPCLIAGWKASRVTGVPLDLFFFDLWLENVLPFFQHLMARLYQPRVFATARYVCAAGAGSGVYLDRQYGLRTVVMNNTADIIELPGVEKNGMSPMVVVLSGSVGWPQADAVLDMVRAINSMDGVEIHVYSHQSVEELGSIGVAGPNVLLCGGLPEEDMRKVQKTADLLFVPMSFGKKGVHVIETAQPAKLVDYMASGVPVLVHAPAYSFVARYAREHDVALVADQPGPEGLKDTLARMLLDRTEARRKAVLALALVARDHDPAATSLRLQSLILCER